MKRAQILRILDANFNRSREGLRVCEEITRFALSEKRLTRDLKRMRHAVSGCLKKIPASTGLELLASRDTRSDVGKKPSRSEGVRRDAPDLFSANIERVKESLRVLEEMSKFLEPPLKPAIKTSAGPSAIFGGRRRTHPSVGPALSEKFKKLRFQAYAVEKRALPKLEALRDRGR